MLRRVAFTSSKASSSSARCSIVPAPVAVQAKRNFVEWIAASPLIGHFGSALTVSAGALPSSPLGTVALVALAYNINYVGLKHLWYTMEMTVRDYLQDIALKQVMRYMLLITLLFAGNGLFVEA
jgi:hypothetical protein